MRIKIIKDYDGYHRGDILNLPERDAKLLLKEGVAIKTKDMTHHDMRIK